MPNPVLVRLMDERAAQVDFIDGLLSRVESESRDLVDAERANLAAARERIGAIDTQREPLEAFESLRSVSEESTRIAYAGATRAATPTGERRPAGGPSAETTYGSPGEFVVDLIRARGYPGQQVEPDPAARARVESALGRSINYDARAVAQQTTDDTPGVLPKPIVGDVLMQLDGARPFVTSIGVRSLAGTPGKTFSRPYISQHVDVGEQVGEKTQLPSRELKIGSLDLNKRTFGGVVNVSRQDIDWTSPSAWDILLNDLQNVYAAETDDAASSEFAADVVQSVPIAAGADLSAWVEALYAAAAMAATGGGTTRASALRLPNAIWTSIDQWATLGAAISQARFTFAGDTSSNASPNSFTGDILNLPRIVVPGFPAGTVVVGRTNLTEFYEERIGVLSAVEPAILGVEVAYGGYAAFGTVDPSAFAKIIADAGALTASNGNGSASKRTNGNGNGSASA